MHLVNHGKSKKKTYALIIACLLNSAFLFFIFFLELHQTLLFNDLHTFEENIVVDIVPEQDIIDSKVQANDAADEKNSNAGLMMRGTPDGTLPPTLFTDYVKETQSPEQPTTELLQDTDNSTTHTNTTAIDQTAEDTIASTNTISEKKIDTTDTLACVAEHEPSFSKNHKKNALPSKILNKRKASPKKIQKKSSSATRSLAQMTRTALNAVTAKGNAAIFSAGDKNRLPSELQLAEEQYWIKLEHSFYNASIQYKNVLPATAINQPKRPLASVIIFYLPDGFIKSVSLQHSSGDQNVDQAILTIFNEVKMLTPPLPRQLREAYGYQRVCVIYC